MKYLCWFFAAFVIMAGCASSSEKNNDVQNLKNLISLETPGEHPYQSSRVYIDSLKQITRDQQDLILIHGTFPDACTHLEEVTHRIVNDSLYLDFKAWRNPKQMCSQVLTPFSFIYDELNSEELSSHSQIIINGTSYSF